MTEKFEIKGLWFLPSNKDKKVPGTLSFDPINGSYLELIGTFEDIGTLYTTNSSQDNSFIILGTSIDSESITLYHCYRSSRRGIRFKRNEELGPPSERYYANFILKGYHFENEESLKFHTIRSSIQNFEEWVNITGFKDDSDTEIENSIRIDYEKPKDIEFDLHTNHSGKFTFSASRPEFNSQKHEYITQEIELELNSVEEKSLKEIHELLTRFQNFLILGIYRSVFPNKIIFYNNNIQNDFGKYGKYRKPIEFYQTTRKRLEVKEKNTFEMLFNYIQIKDSFPLIIKNWFEKYEKLSPAFNLLFEQFYNGTSFTENTFLNLAQSAETLHSRVYDHTKIPKEEYLTMKKEILELVPNKYHNWLKEQLHFGNHLDLAQRLTELTEKYGNTVIDEIIPKKSDFVKQVKDLRNYYTHYSPSLQKKLISERDLMFLSERLKMLLVSGFLYEIGLPKELTNTLFENANHNLFNHLKA
jgi:hypothetical protein